VEIDDIVEGLTDEERNRAAERIPAWLEKAGPMLSELEPRALKWRAENIACPLLENSRCMAYGKRPMSCRTFFAAGNPDDCAMPNRARQKFLEHNPALWISSLPMLFAHTKAVTMDHVGVLLAERLNGIKVESEARFIVETWA
jgi:Fe-S-cluster containining protein